MSRRTALPPGARCLAYGRRERGWCRKAGEIDLPGTRKDGLDGFRDEKLAGASSSRRVPRLTRSSSVAARARGGLRAATTSAASSCAPTSMAGGGGATASGGGRGQHRPLRLRLPQEPDDPMMGSDDEEPH